MRPLTFEPFVRGQTSQLLRLAYLLTNDAGDAEDLVQEALLSALRHWDKVESAANPAAYVRRMLVNHHISSTRRRWTSEVVIGADILALHDSQAPAGPSAHEQVDARYWALSVIRSLPPRQRAVLVLRYYEGLDDAEIGDALGLSRGSVRSVAARAFATLREHPQLAGYHGPNLVAAAAATLAKESDRHGVD